MSAAEFVIGVLEIIGLTFALIVFVAESERLPGRYLNWSAYVTGGTDRYNKTTEIRIGVRRKGDYVRLRTLDPTAEDFDDLLAEAQSYARERCIALNSTAKALGRRLPS